MVALGALVALLITIGLTVAGFAFFGSRKPSTGPAKSGAHRPLFVAITVVCLAVGIALPARLITNNNADAAKRAPGGVDLTASQAKGRTLFAKTCATCHTLRASNSVGKIGPNLDVLRPPAALVADALKNGRAQGNGNMPALLLSGDDAKNVASYIAAVAGH